MKARLGTLLVLALALAVIIVYLRRERLPSRNGSVSRPGQTVAAVSLPHTNESPGFESAPATNYPKLLRDWLGTRRFDNTNASAAKAIVACRLLEKPEVVAYVKSNFLATAQRRIKTAQSPPFWGMEDRELPSSAKVEVSANIATGFRAAITFPDLPNSQGKIFVQVEGGTDPYISRLENSASTEGAVIGSGNSVDPVAGWCWTNAIAAWDIKQAEYWVRAALNDFGSGESGAEINVKIRPSDYAAPTDGNSFPALSKQSVRYPFASFEASLATDPQHLLCNGTFAQTGPNQFRLVVYSGYFNGANPLGDLADKFLSTSGSVAWAQDIINQAQADPQQWLMKAMQLIAVQPPSAQ